MAEHGISNDELTRDYGTTLTLRIGVNTGEVVTGTAERLATGDAVVVAARLEQGAPPGEILRTDFVGVSVTDRDRSSGFYGDVLGLRRNERSTDELPEFEGENVGLILSTPKQRNEPEFRPNAYSLALRVADVGESAERLRGAGVEVFPEEPYDTGVCHMAFFSDPEGNDLMLHHRYAPYDG